MASLPADGAVVTATTYPSVEYERDAERVHGQLRLRPTPFGGPPQCWVDGRQVDPASVQEAGAPDAE